MTTLETRSSSTIDQYVAFLKLPMRARWDKICEILDFYIAGEEHNKQLLFFLILGNYHKNLKTLVLYRGDSSGGKNFVIRNEMLLFPTDDGYAFSSMTPKALHYMEETLNNIKFMFLNELAERDKELMTDFIKAMFDEGGKRHLETVRDTKEQRYSVLEHIQHQIGIITTFSFESIQIDLINRGWTLIPDEEHAQTERVVKEFKLTNESVLIDRDIKDAEMANKCFFIQQCIKALDFEYDVYISYARKLEPLFPCKNISERRDVNKLIQLIKIITLWNQYGRRSVEIAGRKYLFSEYEDLELALEICQDLFIELLLHIDKVKRLILDYCREMVEVKTMPLVKKEVGTTTAGGGKGKQHNLDLELVKDVAMEEVEVEKKYTVSEVFEALRDEMGISRKTVSRKMADLYAEGYLKREKVGGSYQYIKIKEYNIVNALELDKMEDEITELVERQYEFYKDKTEELLRGGYDLMKEMKDEGVVDINGNENNEEGEE